MELRITLSLLYCCAAWTSAAKHFHSTLYTVTRASCQPEFTAVSFVNDWQITRYDSENKTLTAMHSWVREALSDQHWEKYKEKHLSEYSRLREELNATMKSLGHVKDVHTFQRRSGCEWDDVTGLSKGFDEYGYDGEDFISLDLNQMKYVPHTPQANITSERWNRDRALIQSQSSYHNHECVNWLKRSISFFQRTAFSPVICHVAGFCPSAMKISWRKDGKDMKENVRTGAVLPDGEGTYLRDVSINVTELSLNTFTCVVGNTHRDLTKDQLKSENREQKDSSSPVVCFATGFYPKAVMLSWQKNGQDVSEDVELTETLSNGDGTFQKKSFHNVGPKEWNMNKYSCVVQHMSQAITLTASKIRTNGVAANTFHTELTAAVTLVITCSVFIWIFIVKCRKDNMHIKQNPND
ncbi:hypothetical protein AOLI_G00271840 [Acnodon oligacanthus]